MHISINSRSVLAFVILFTFTSHFLAAQTPQPDVLIFTDGETLLGHLERATASSVTFKSNMAGEITVDWSKIKELRSSERFAVIKKGAKLSWRQSTAGIAQGTLTASGSQIQIQAAANTPPVNIPTNQVQNVVGAEEFQKAVGERPNFFADWKGSATAGVSLVEATQNERTFTGTVNLTRTMPTEDWLNPSNRTSVLFSDSYGTLSQPGTPSVKTSILHASAERDQYFSPNLFGFAQADFLHNYAQGLDLQQTYGGGVGWTVIKNTNEQLDVRAAITYIRQQFQLASANQNLVGSLFSQTFDRKFVHGIDLHELLAISPAWNNTNAYSANGEVGLTFPVYKRLGFTIDAQDSYLNNPPLGFKKNSFTFTTGATYTVP